jgi:hypothetical protein
MLKPVHKATMKKIARRQGTWTGYISPSNVNEFHIQNGWMLGMPITVEYRDGKYMVVLNSREMELEDFIVNYAWYNCNSEVGKRVRFWQETA